MFIKSSLTEQKFHNKSMNFVHDLATLNEIELSPQWSKQKRDEFDPECNSIYLLNSDSCKNGPNKIRIFKTHKGCSIVIKNHLTKLLNDYQCQSVVEQSNLI